MISRLKINSATFQIIIITIVVFLLRVLVVNVYSGIERSFGEFLFETYDELIQMHWLVIFIVVVNITFVLLLNKYIPYGKYPVRKMLLSVVQICLLSVIVVLIANYKEIFLSPIDRSYNHILTTFFVVVLLNILLIFVTYIIQYIILSKNAVSKEKGKRHKAQYQYNQLKQQLNPHFLFNSLNILDYLVKSNENERASAFVNKLAKVYRYLLSTESVKLVPVSQELEFANMYVDLLKERFVAGLNVEISVPYEDLNSKVIPCGLQILVENAIKHNIINSDHPLFIEIFIENNFLVVKNNLQLRKSRQESTGLGLKNIECQYSDITDVNIEIVSNRKEFVVKLPLL